MSAETTRLAALKPRLEIRARMLQAVRRFFFERGFTEVDTPVRIAAPALETHIDAEPCGECFLRTSPELHMKRLLAAGYERVFQMGPCFRRGEFGRRHNPEYTMLEWYRANADYLDMLQDAKSLVAFVAGQVHGAHVLKYQGQQIELMPVWEWRTVAQSFIEFAGWDPTVAFDPDRFDTDLLEKVEPGLPRHCPVILADYPAPAAALARLKPGNARVAERWELYIAGIELANAYSELVDAAEQKRRFEACAAERARLGKTVYPLDERFLDALASGMPPSGGVALGVDRLAMLLTDAPSLDEVLPFRQPDG